MRDLGFGIALGVLVCTIGVSSAWGMPRGHGAIPIQQDSGVVQIQWTCNMDGCFDVRTGAFTESACNRRGCYPTSGVVGRMTPHGPAYRPGYGYALPDPYYPPPRRYYPRW
ncbi:hypothetical protein GGD64_002790 [Bradyrhizobium sp. CIR3A]|nr:hypothetical protein [Bradyrhizobium sp. CIR3A]